jgi:hypothetical protein
MAERKTVPLDTKEDVVSMEFDDNPNIPTANYNEETANKIQEAIKKKMRAEKLKKMIDAELKQNDRPESEESIGFAFSFKGM